MRAQTRVARFHVVGEIKSYSHISGRPGRLTEFPEGVRAGRKWGADYRVANTIDIDGRVALTPAPEVLRDIGLGKGPTKSLVAFGYAGWAPSQLDNEIARGDWYNVPEDSVLVFDDDRSNVWADAMARRKVDH